MREPALQPGLDGLRARSLVRRLGPVQARAHRREVPEEVELAGPRQLELQDLEDMHAIAHDVQVVRGELALARGQPTVGSGLARQALEHNEVLALDHRGPYGGAHDRVHPPRLVGAGASDEGHVGVRRDP
eukprot:14101462-Alexandrium_andersonii.AAC.1